MDRCKTRCTRSHSSGEGQLCGRSEEGQRDCSSGVGQLSRRSEESQLNHRSGEGQLCGSLRGRYKVCADQ